MLSWGSKYNVLKLQLTWLDSTVATNCLRISGVPKTADENTDYYICDFAHALDVDLTINDIDRIHPVGKPVTSFRNTPRDIIVKFVSYRMRAKFYKARVLISKNRGYKGVFINEDLTKSKVYLCKKPVLESSQSNWRGRGQATDQYLWGSMMVTPSPASARPWRGSSLLTTYNQLISDKSFTNC